MWAVAWFVAGVCAFLAEMFVGGFYLLVIGIGCLIASGSMYFLGVGWIMSLLVAAVSMLLAHVVFCRLRKSKAGSAKTEADKLDEGAIVTIETVLSNGQTRVFYRGAQWLARAETGILVPGDWHIAGQEGNTLLLRR